MQGRWVGWVILQQGCPLCTFQRESCVTEGAKALLRARCLVLRACSTCFRIIGDEEVLYEMNLHEGVRALHSARGAPPAAASAPDSAPAQPLPPAPANTRQTPLPPSKQQQQQPQQQATPSSSLMDTSTVQQPG